MESFCRLCSASHKVANLNNLFDEKNIHLSQKLNHFTCSTLNLDVKEILYICIRCTELLEAAYEFKLICESAEARLSVVSQSNSHTVKIEVLCNPETATASQDETLGLLEASNASHFVVEANCKNEDAMESPTFYCAVCGLHKSNKIDLINHMKVHRTDEPTFKPSPDKSKGQRRRKKRNSICDLCNTSFCRKLDLERHIKSIHNVFVNDEKPCDDKRIAWICETCGREYKSKHTLQYHINGAHVGTVEKKFSCTLCDYKCREARSLVSHQQVHSSEKAHQCSECGKSFRHKPGLTRHILYFHRREKRHKCTICDQSFFSKFRLKEHLFVHTGQHPLECTLCSRTYRYKNCLSKHMRKRHQDAREQKQGI